MTELTVRCSDSNFDGGVYYLSRYSPEENSVVCLDKNLRVATTSSEEAKGLGVFAKRRMENGSIITSTPLVPVHRSEIKITDETINDNQLMLNYLFGHPDSDLLLLPIGPMVNFINHNHQHPNAVIRWHKVKDQHKMEGSLERREEYHHPEMLTVPTEVVVATHGKGLMMDIIALRDIKEGEEIFLDYGREWQVAWETHKAEFEMSKYSLSLEDINYISAERFMAKSNSEKYYRTLFEQGTNPYPDNLQTYCFYEQHNDELLAGEDDTYRKYNGSSRGFKRFSWNDHPEHPCMRPCTIAERYETADEDEPRYNVEMFRDDNDEVMYYCSISMDYFYKDVPHSDIRLLDRARTTDVFRKSAFRHEIGVPDGFYPREWMRKKLRATASVEDTGEIFKRKEAKDIAASSTM
jgi:hypothetical protein